jgi:predicted RecB family nuclease
MVKRTATRRTCPQGHTYTKSTDCPTCPVCEAQKAKAGFFIDGLGAPVRRALDGMGIDSLKKLARHTETDILALHGVGPSSLPVMRAALKAAGLSFRT